MTTETGKEWRDVGSAAEGDALRRPPVNLGEPLRFRPATWMRRPLKLLANTLSEAAGHPVGLGGAIRDLVSRGLKSGPDAAYLSGFREGFTAAYADTKNRLARGRGANGRHDVGNREGGPIGPQPPNDNDDYQVDGEGEP